MVVGHTGQCVGGASMWYGSTAYMENPLTSAYHQPKRLFYSTAKTNEFCNTLCCITTNVRHMMSLILLKPVPAPRILIMLVGVLIRVITVFLLTKYLPSVSDHCGTVAGMLTV